LDLGVSKRTFERIKGELLDLGFELIYERPKGYWIDQDESVFFKDMDEFIHSLNSFNFMIDSLKDVSKIHKYVHTHKSLAVGKGLLADLVQSCLDHQIIEFEHHNFRLQKWTKKKVQPYQLREHEGKWYIIGIEDHKPSVILKSFGVDRMRNLQLSGDLFTPDAKVDPDSYYAEFLGMWTESISVERIVLEVDSLNWNWIRSQPWHSTQRFELELDGKVQFSLLVKPTLDLQRKILEWVPNVSVIQPDSLKVQIIERLNQGLKEYI